MAHPRYVGLRLSTTAGAVPTAADIREGELAINTADGRVYTLAGSTIIDLTDRYSVAEIDDLLDGKANTSHTHPWGEVTGKPATYPPSSHSHTLGEITDAGSAAAEDTSAFDPAGSAAAAEQRIRDTLKQQPDPLLMHFL